MEKNQLIALVRNSQAGDPDAMEQLLAYTHTWVSYQCRKMLKNAQDAEDLTQEVLVTIYTKLDTLQEPAAFRKWANQITASRCVNALNRTHVEYQFAEDEDGHSILDTLEELDEQMIPDKAIDNAETARMIEEIVTGLPDAQRAATLMFYYSEMSVKEIAQAMKVSENTVKSRLNYARKAIKEQVLDYEKQGIKLYGLSPLPFLLYFLRTAAQSSADKKAAGVLAVKIMAAEGAAVGIAAGTGTGAVTAAAVSGSAATTAATGTTAAAGIFSALSAKVAAGVLAAVVTIGTAAVAVPHLTKEPTVPPTVSATAAISTETEAIMETEPPTTEAVTEPSAPETTEVPTAVPTEVPATAPAQPEPTASATVPTAAPTEPTEAPTEVPTEPPTEEPQETEPAHSHSYTETVTDPTCDCAGYTTYICDCGDSYTDNETEALGHRWNDGTVTRAATCDADGSMNRTCQRCGETIAESIPMFGHDMTEWIVIVEPATDHEGTEMTACQNAGCSYMFYRSIPMLSSDDTDVETVPPGEHTCSYAFTDNMPHSCTESGYFSMTCTVCGDTQTIYKESQAHNYVSGVCTVCGKTQSSAQEACPHAYESQEIGADVSETGEAYILYSCWYCGHSYTEPVE